MLELPNFDHTTTSKMYTFVLKRPKMVNFADIFKIATMFLKKAFKNSRNLKTGNIWIKIQSISVLLDMTKDGGFRLKNAYVRRTHELFHLIFIFFGPSLGKV